MKLIPRRSVAHKILTSLFNRRRATTLTSFVSAVNLFVGVFVLIFIVIVQDSRQKKTTSYEIETNMEYVQINNNVPPQLAMPQVDSRRKVSSDYYFRIDYTIQHAICQPVNVFYGKNALNTIRSLTVDEINGILADNVKIHLNVLRINAALKSSERVTELLGTNKTEKLICAYVLELFVIINFPIFCDYDCQMKQFNILTTNKNLFGDLPNSSLKFSLPDITLPDEPIVFHVYDFAIYRTSKYLDKALFIQSAGEPRFVSTKYFLPTANQSLVSLSSTEKNLFVMKKGLDTLDSSSIYVSFLALSIPNLYLRHEEGKLKLAKYDQSLLFRQDATFKLIFDYRNDIVAFQAINLPTKFYIAATEDQEPILVLMQLDGDPTIETLEKQFVFKLIPAA